MLVSHVSSRKVVTHFVKDEGTTVCGRLPEGKEWIAGMLDTTRTVCRKCSKRVELGISRLFTCCPKCASDLGQHILLSPDRSCPNCRSTWQ